MKWHIVLRVGVSTANALLPSEIMTVKPSFRHENMPDEVSLLLPTNKGPRHLIDQVSNNPGHYGNVILGLFLANPFLNTRLEGTRLARAGVRWVTNLPSVEQQDHEFSRQLTDVVLDQDKELDYLIQFRDQGFRIATVVADGPGATSAVAIAPQIIIVMPRVVDFVAGFPSLRQRATAVQAVANATCNAGWAGVLLGLGNAQEAKSEDLWPNQWDGLIYRQPFIA